MTMNCHTVTLGMLLREADVHEKNGKRQEATKIKEWVADLLSEQSKAVQVGLAQVAQAKLSDGLTVTLWLIFNNPPNKAKLKTKTRLIPLTTKFEAVYDQI